MVLLLNLYKTLIFKKKQREKKCVDKTYFIISTIDFNFIIVLFYSLTYSCSMPVSVDFLQLPLFKKSDDKSVKNNAKVVYKLKIPVCNDMT